MFDPFMTVKQIMRKLGGDILKNKKAVVPEATVSATFAEEQYAYMLDGSIAGGKDYIVTINGVKYKCKSCLERMDETTSIVMLGNGLTTLPPDLPPEHMEEIFAGLPKELQTEVPFIIAYYPGMLFYMQHKDGDIGPITISISEEVETIVPIDQKYLPGVKEINLADYGIDIATIVMSGQKISAVGDMGIWAEIDKYKEVVFVATMGQTFKITPTVYAFGTDGGAMMVGFTLVAINDNENLMEVKIVLLKSNSITGIFCVTTTTNLG